MNLFTISLHSEALRKGTQVNVLLPDGASQSHPAPVLWLLHGMSDDHNGWLRRTTIELEAEARGICVVMPNADLSFYVDMAYGADYFTYLTEELPAFLARSLPVARPGAGHAVAGVSMGGYGAFLLALSRPEQYAAAVSLSGPMNIAWIERTLSDPALAEAWASGKREEANAAVAAFVEASGVPPALVHSLMEFGGATTVRTFRAMFGENARLDGSRWDLAHLAKPLAETERGPRLLAYCGEQDYHYSSNIRFRDAFSGSGLDYELRTGPGAHEWGYWNACIPNFMEELYAPES